MLILFSGNGSPHAVVCDNRFIGSLLRRLLKEKCVALRPERALALIKINPFNAKTYFKYKLYPNRKKKLF